MEHEPLQMEHLESEGGDKSEWEEPKLTFVEPTLTEHGSVQKLTGGFFGSFTP